MAELDSKRTTVLQQIKQLKQEPSPTESNSVSLSVGEDHAAEITNDSTAELKIILFRSLSGGMMVIPEGLSARIRERQGTIQPLKRIGKGRVATNLFGSRALSIQVTFGGDLQFNAVPKCCTITLLPGYPGNLGLLPIIGHPGLSNKDPTKD